MIVIADCKAAIRICAAAHGQVSRCGQNQISLQGSCAVYGSLGIDRGVIGVVRAHFIQQLSKRKDFPDRRDKKVLMRVVASQYFSTGVDNTHSPQVAFY